MSPVLKLAWSLLRTDTTAPLVMGLPISKGAALYAVVRLQPSLYQNEICLLALDLWLSHTSSLVWVEGDVVDLGSYSTAGRLQHNHQYGTADLWLARCPDTYCLLDIEIAKIFHSNMLACFDAMGRVFFE